jgi:dethiobiotin synthetase/adenosylmethionine--8-amino-7-oxononanoate aminotransferase
VFPRLNKSKSIKISLALPRLYGKLSYAAVMKTLILNSISRSHIIFGSNTDVGKTIVSAGLVRCALLHPEVKAREKRPTRPTALVNYIKPLQSGGSDADYVQNVVAATACPSHAELRCRTLFQWDAPASPHYASRIEGKPASDEEILTRLQSEMLRMQVKPSADSVVTYVESAGGVMSPASASPRNISANHSRSNTACNKAWGWSTQADLYTSLNLPVVLVGDSKLGGISSTLTALEALLFRGYSVDALIMIRSSSAELEKDCVNIEACREYLSRYVCHISEAAYCYQYLACVYQFLKIPFPLKSCISTQQTFFKRDFS